jgi:hypothetical protein
MTRLPGAANPNAIRPFLGFANITAWDNGDNSNYNALQIAANRRILSKGFPSV